MASYTAIAAGGNWSANATWGGAGHPIAGDTAIIPVAMVGTVTVDAASACAVIDCTGCTGTLTFTTFNLTTTSTVTLASGMTINVGTTAIWNMGCAAVAFTPAGKTLGNVNFSVTGTLTITGGVMACGVLSVATGITATLASNNINVSGGLTNTGTGIITGQTITLSGGTWSATGAGSIGSNLTITGAVTISGNVYYKTGTINTSAATITWSSGTFNVAGSCTLTDNNAGTPNWLNSDIAGYATGTITFSQVTKVKNFRQTTNGALFVIGGSGVVVTGNVSTNGSGYISGTLTMTGETANATISQNAQNTYGYYGTIIFLAGANTITIGQYLTLGVNGAIVYTSGNIVTTNSTLQLSSINTITTDGIVWNNITRGSGGSTTTLGSNLSCTGVFTISIATTFIGSYLITTGSISHGAFTLTLSANMTCTGNYTNTGASVISGAFALSIGGSLTLAFALSGAASITLNGTGTWSTSSSTCTLSNALTFNGNVTISGSVYYNNATLTYTSGTVIVTGSTLQLNVSCSIVGSMGLIMATLRISYNASVSTDGSMTMDTLYMDYLSQLTMPAASTLTVSTAMRLYASTIKSATPSSSITLTYNGTAENNTSAFATFVDVVASITLYVWQVTALTRTSNIISVNAPGSFIYIED